MESPFYQTTQNNPVFGDSSISDSRRGDCDTLPTQLQEQERAHLDTLPAQEEPTSPILVNRSSSPRDARPSYSSAPRRTTPGNRPSFLKRNDTICSTQGTKVSHLRKIIDDPNEQNMTKKQLARELVKYDVDEDGWVSTGEMLEAIIEVVDKLKMSLTDLDRIASNRGTIGKKVAQKLKEKDRDGDGEINADELVDAMEELCRDEESSKFWFRFSMFSSLLTLFTIIIIVGLSVALQISLKDTKVDSSSATLTGYRGAAAGQPIRVASSDFALSSTGDLVSRNNSSSQLVNVASKLTTHSDCPNLLSADYLRDVRTIELDLSQDQTLFLTSQGLIIGDDHVTFFTHLGNITFQNNCQQVEGEVIDYLLSRGLVDVPSAKGRRRLFQAQTLRTSSGSTNTTSKPPKLAPPSTIFVSIGSSIDCTKNPPPSGCLDSGCNVSCADNGLCLANFYRKNHGTPPLVYNKTMEVYAQDCVSNSSQYCVMEDCTTNRSGTSAYVLGTTNSTVLLRQLAML